jgi:hypothetical protein
MEFIISHTDEILVSHSSLALKLAQTVSLVHDGVEETCGTSSEFAPDDSFLLERQD